MSLEARKIRLLMKLRRSGVSDHRVLGAIERVPREAFVPDTFLDQAYEDIALPIGLGQTISQPMVVALMTQALEVGDRDKVLEIGTGSGYQAAVLARLCRRLYTIERHRGLYDTAMRRIQELRLHNVTAKLGDGTRGWPEQAPFQRI
ncbi:MAG: protein-L-isoaspartate(D-aspartate) O-methyltransferase, partial [Alphaproteobacteria bacterium]|nr:protein-L-isoaspartate(D-aspartate) O-methyltransferase [Alphaproteobacteria bacterium]